MNVAFVSRKPTSSELAGIEEAGIEEAVIEAIVIAIGDADVTRR
jgi:hypothetical protein